MGDRVASLVVGAETRDQRRRRAGAERRLRRELAEERRARERRVREATRALWAGEHLPALGERGPRTARQLREARVGTLRATTKTLRVAYPFVAEEGLGGEGILIGRDVVAHTTFAFDPFALYRRGVLSNTNMTLAGVIGTGKSALMKCLALRAAAFGYRTFIPGDVKGEWTRVVRAAGGVVVGVAGAGRRRLNPLDEGRRPEVDEYGARVDDGAWREMVRSQRIRLVRALATTLMGGPLTGEDDVAVAAAVDRAVARGGVPLLATVVEELLVPSPGPLPTGVRDDAEMAAMGRRCGRYLQRLITGDLRGMFDGPSTVAFDAAAPMMSIDLRGIEEGDERLPLLMTCTQTWMESALRGSGMGRRLMIYDEAHRLMGAPGLLRRMQDQWKLCRAWGIANILVLHRLSDTDAAGAAGSRERALAEGLVADTSTRIVYRQEADQLGRTAERLGLNAVGARTVSVLNPGVGLWMVAGRRFVVAHDRTDWETGLTDTDDALGGRS